MSFTDYIFIPSIFLLFLVYFIVPKKFRWFVLLLASVAFYGSWGINMFPFILFSVMVIWLGSLGIDRIYKTQDAYVREHTFEDRKEKAAYQKKMKKKCKYVLWLAAGLIIAVLVAFKLQNKWPEIPELERFSLIVPLGISYYTMSLVGYLADVYWRKEKAETNFLKLLLFAIYFPKIVEGPISKHRLIAEQLNEGHEFNYTRLCYGLQRMLWGYFKKLVIADRMNMVVQSVYGNYAQHYGSELIIATICGAFQLYCDFSGCMDIALGLSEVFGITLEENFNHPFFAASAAEFWRRWHITLGTWFKDYVFMPLSLSPRLLNIAGKLKNKYGRKAGKLFMQVVPLSAVWILTGVWHGTGWNYVVWGIYWGVLIILAILFESQLMQMNQFLGIDTDSVWFKRFRMIRTFILFIISRILTIPSSLQVSGAIVRKILFQFGAWRMFGGHLLELGLDGPNMNIAILALLLLGFVSKKQEEGIVIRDKIAMMPAIFRWIILYGSIFAVLLFGVYGIGYNASSFVYMNY